MSPVPAFQRVMHDYARRGATCRLRPAAGGVIVCDDCGHGMPASHAMCLHSRRIDNQSDPADQSILVEVRLPTGADRPACHGVMVLGYGPTASPVDRRVLGDLD